MRVPSRFCCNGLCIFSDAQGATQNPIGQVTPLRHTWIENYLASRNHIVTFNNTSSFTKPINIGVPQSSIFGPLLFLIYINDLPNVINSTPRLFADDTCLILQQSSLSFLEKACSNALVHVKDWCDANKIQINSNKSYKLHLPPKQNTTPLTFKFLTIIPS